ncbi:MAG: GNAT family N-acetyltransferase [Candidatus Latescibacteria bacterium]|nr:GNAT family N-acetyltransferase [Candidatus Latescibacterota bacterium]
MVIEHISFRPDFIRTIAQWQFDQWHDLTGFSTVEGYIAFLEQCVEGTTIPYVLVAHSDNQLLGSVNLVACDMTIRPELTPWLAQLFVSPDHRGQGIGTALVHAAIERMRDEEFEWLYLYTSGTLPHYYERLGFTVRERVNYLGKERAVMEYPLVR